MSYCTMCSKISFPIQITPIWLPSSTSDQGGGVQKDSRWSEQNLHFSFVQIPEHTSSIKFNLAIGPGLSIPSTELAVRYFHSISQSLHTTSEKHCISTLCILSRSSSILKLSLRWIVSLHTKAEIQTIRKRSISNGICTKSTRKAGATITTNSTIEDSLLLFCSGVTME